MSERTDHELLAEFARGGSEAAFEALVARHVNLVYSTAWRFAGNPNHAEEISQAVFIILARKAGTISRRVVLSGWLYQAARLTAANFVKGEFRRQRREQEAFMQSNLNDRDKAVAWEQLEPLLDEAMGRLGNADRVAIVMRYFENKSATEIAAALRLTEAAAHKRVNRAVEKLQRFFLERGVASTAAVIVGAISANSMQGAPAGVAKAISAAAVTKGAAAGGSTATMVKGALKIMAWTKAKTAIAAAAAVLMVGTAGIVSVKTVYDRRMYAWRVAPAPLLDPAWLDKAPPQARILATQFPDLNSPYPFINNGDRVFGIGVDASNLVRAAYNYLPARMIVPANLFSGDLAGKKYDFMANLKEGSKEALRKELRKTLGITASWRTQVTDVYLLKVNHPNAPGLKSADAQSGPPAVTQNSPGQLEIKNQPLSSLTGIIEGCAGRPILDRTELPGSFDISLKWKPFANSGKPNVNALMRALTDQLGLELVPAREPAEMCVAEIAKAVQ